MDYRYTTKTFKGYTMKTTTKEIQALTTLNRACRFGTITLEYYNEPPYTGYNNLIITGVLNEQVDTAILNIEILGAYKLVKCTPNLDCTLNQLVFRGL